ncbi:MAG TPA: MBL fold metallo-hydrolase [Bradyrhizobium sp.]|nr:MBL fold metallo-hydrolase [Bradyrhizobium sp.]
MKLTFLKSSTVIIESNDVRILTDPWLVDGEYYGSWAHYPEPQADYDLSDIDFIYVSHIHPDHLSHRTMAKLPKHIPVLIHRYEAPFLQRNIEAMGFEVTPLPHNVRHHLKNGVYINILAADDCNPELCAKFLGCASFQAKVGSTQIDSLCVVDDGKAVLVNTNDCPPALALEVIPKIKQDYKNIDLLLVGYSGAGPFPQCFANLTLDQKEKAAAQKKQSFLTQNLQYVQHLKPRYVFPFAGQYVLAGRLWQLNKYRGVADVEEAAEFFQRECPQSQAVLLNAGESFDVESGTSSADYVPTDCAKRDRYISEILSRRSYLFDNDEQPSDERLFELVQAAAARLERKRQDMGFQSETVVFVDLGNDHVSRISMKDGSIQVGRRTGFTDDRFVEFRTDRKLLNRILSGPKYAHWNNAEIGSHIEFYRSPETFERGLYSLMNFFHA